MRLTNWRRICGDERATGGTDGVLPCGSEGERPYGAPGIGSEEGREAGAIVLKEHAAKVEQVQQWAGHADIRTTQEYIEYHEQDAEAAARHNQIRPKSA